MQMSINLYVCVCLDERSSRQVVVDSGSFLSEKGEAAALLRFPLHPTLSVAGVREVGGGGGEGEVRWGPTYKSESLP